MFDQIKPDHLDLLEQNLIVPLAVGDILKHNLPVEPEMQYGLHMALSEIDPDSAVLAVALCALNIAEKFYLEIPIAAGLKKEAQEIIGNYAPNWIYHHKRGPMQSEIYTSILSDIPEDLEALADIMDALAADLDHEFENIESLIHILSIQARAHMEISEYLLTEIDTENEKNAEEDTENMASKTSVSHANGENVILFPIDRVN
jgi:hypothetical protein